MPDGLVGLRAKDQRRGPGKEMSGLVIHELSVVSLRWSGVRVFAYRWTPFSGTDKWVCLEKCVWGHWGSAPSLFGAVRVRARRMQVAECRYKRRTCGLIAKRDGFGDRGVGRPAQELADEC